MNIGVKKKMYVNNLDRNNRNICIKYYLMHKIIYDQFKTKFMNNDFFFTYFAV